MSRIIFIVGTILLSSMAAALRLEFLAETTLPHKLIFQKTRIGAVSGLWFDSNTSSVFAVSDDRGSVDEPRFYKFHLEYKKQHLKMEPEEVFRLRGLKEAHVTEKLVGQVLDMEAMAPLPWGNFLISNEGDNNRKPRFPPQLLDVKKDGSLVRIIDLPSKFIPEKTGEQHRGIRNNKGIEGLTGWPDKNLIWAWTEGPLLQDSGDDSGPLRVLQWEMPEAWVLKPSKEFIYTPEAKKISEETISLGAHVSEALAISEHEFLVLERTVVVSSKGLGLRCQLYLASLKEAEDVSGIESLRGKDMSKLKKMTKNFVLDLESIKDKLGGSVDNFEGMSWGPLVDGKKTLILASDDNFKKIQKTQFVLMKLIEE